MLLAQPNPSSNKFTIQVKSSNIKDRIMMQVFDVNGRQVELRNNIYTGSTIQIGEMYRPGSYYVRVMQGKDHKEIKLIKLSD